MRKKELITKTANRAGVSKSSCETVIDAFIEEIKKSLSNDEKVMINGFISFEVIERAERRSVNFKTGDPIVYPSVKSIKCKASKLFKDAVNAKQ